MSNLNREFLLQTLNLAKPAIASQSFVPALTHFAFDGWGVLAYNDISAIGIKAEIDFPVCLPADLLVKSLNSMSAEKVALQMLDDDAVVISSGRSKVKMPYLPASKFPFEFPSVDWDKQIVLSSQIIAGIEKCIVGVGSDPSHPSQMGITLAPSKKGARLYSTDNATISSYSTTTKIELPGDSPVILPTFFCEQLLALSKAFPKEEIRMALLNGAVCAMVGEQALIHSKMLVDLEPMDFEHIIGRYTDGDSMDFEEIPDGFDAALNRAMLVLSSEMDKASKITLDDGRMSMLSKSPQGEASDSFKVKTKQDLVFHVDPSLVIRGCKICRKVAFHEKALILGSENFLHLIAHCAV